jgi:adenosine kinase
LIEDNKILVVGKAAYIVDFSISDDFPVGSKKDDKTMITTGTDLKRTYGGMGANVAYGLAILGSKPIIVSQGGYDFDCFYRSHLENVGVVVRLFIDEEKETSCFYEIKDKMDEVLTINQENSYRYFAERDILEKFEPGELELIDCAFVGTGKAEADTKFITTIHEQNKRLPIIYSFDSNITELTKWRLTQIIDKITILVCTEDELKIVEERLKQSCGEILANSKRLKYIISMVLRSKIIIHSKDFKIKVAEGPAEEILSEEIWKDAFRAGLTYGISLKKPIDEAAKIGSALASYAVETRENQKFSPSLEQVNLRGFEVKTSRKNR